MPTGIRQNSLRLSVRILTLLLLCLTPGLSSCGPKEISSSAGRVDRDYYGPPGPDTMAEMRYPTLGSLNRSRELYFYRMSQPSYFEAVQNRQASVFKRRFKTIDPESPAYREHPKSVSPFRE